MRTRRTPSPTPIAPRFLLLAALCGAFAACSRSGGATPPESRITVVETSPPSGATDVEPSTPIALTLAAGSSALTAADVIVSDGSNRLPGTVTRNGSSGRWTWTPLGELPRGATITVATARQGVVATFAVRDILVSIEIDLPNEEVENALSWRNARSALRTRSGRVFELIAGSDALVERFCYMPPGARAIGDGRFVGEQENQGVRYCVRGDLAGALDVVPTPLGVSLGDCNAAGDVVVFVPGDVGTPAEQGLWRLRHDEVAFELVGPLSLLDVVDRPSIEADGTVSIAWSDNGTASLARFAPGDLAGQRFSLVLDGAPPPSSVHFDAADDGRGVLAFGIATAAPGEPDSRYIVRAARFDPATGLQLLPDELRNWVTGLSPNSPFWRVDDLVVGDHGSAVVVLAQGLRSSQQVDTHFEAVRVEVDDSVGPPFAVAETIVALPPAPPLPLRFGEVRITPGRAELWGMSTLPQLDSVVLTRSRPAGPAWDTVYTFASNRSYGDWCFTCDDSGRGFYAVVEWELLGPLVGSRIVVIE
ncbi:MAG: hypothetical protein H6835_16510 [Planctomycetes bacterium]|nr:hypothetical protein [Planctomycetota bacterium]